MKMEIIKFNKGSFLKGKPFISCADVLQMAGLKDGAV